MAIDELLAKCSENNNFTIYTGLCKAQRILMRSSSAVCSISGGSDSDIVLDIIHNVDEDGKVKYFWIDTGLEYTATKEHLDFLEEKYGITIERIKPEKSIPTCVRQYGVPFLSKYVSEQMMRLQAHHFQWEDEPLEVLLKKYPKCKTALQWWCGERYSDAEGIQKISRFSIYRNRFLKEFIIANPPDFPISNKCCEYSKKKPAKKFIKDNDADLDITGIRQAEGGIRSATYKTCFSECASKGCNTYRPLFWYDDDEDEIRFYDNMDEPDDGCLAPVNKVKPVFTVGMFHFAPLDSIKVDGVTAEQMDMLVYHISLDKFTSNNSKVSGHHAIIPTSSIGTADLSSLPSGESNILKLIAAKLICATAPVHKYEAVKITAECKGTVFSATGRTVLEMGWKAYAKQNDKKAEETVLPAVSEGQTFVVTAKKSEHFTSPPKPFTEDTLLSAMERAGNEDYDEDTEKKGLGTPATRAATIESLVKNGYVDRVGKQLRATDKGKELIKVVPDEVKSAKLTAEWESKLQQIEHGSLPESVFMRCCPKSQRTITRARPIITGKQKGYKHGYERHEQWA